MNNEALHHSKKDRVLVRTIAGTYNLKDELARSRAQPCVRKASDIKFIDGPQAFSRHYFEPKDGITQTLHLHLEEYDLEGKSQKQDYVNETTFCILDGTGCEIHDGIHYDWTASDITIVHNNCVHQHFNADAVKPARSLVIKTKPMYLFMNMLFQYQVEPRSLEPAPGGEGFEVREADLNFNHAE